MSRSQKQMDATIVDVVGTIVLAYLPLTVLTLNCSLLLIHSFIFLVKICTVFYSPSNSGTFTGMHSTLSVVSTAPAISIGIKVVTAVNPAHANVFAHILCSGMYCLYIILEQGSHLFLPLLLVCRLQIFM